MNRNDRENIYIIPHNFTENGKILGFIEKESAVSALVWFVPVTFLNFKLLPFSLDVRIFTFIILVCPPALLLLFGIGSETFVNFVRFSFRFLKWRKVYLYERKDRKCG